MDPIPSDPDSSFPLTHLSVVRLAGEREHPAFRGAWEQFFRAYWPPLHSYLRRTGSSHEEALDLLQDFFIECLDGDLLARYDAARGRLRSFLLTCLRNARENFRRHQKARPDRVLLSFLEPNGSTDDLPSPTSSPPEEAFEEEWAETVFRHSIASLEQQLALRQENHALRVFREWVLQANRPEASMLAGEMHISTGDLYMKATRLRQALVEEIDAQIRMYTATEDELKQERESLLRRLASRRIVP